MRLRRVTEMIAIAGVAALIATGCTEKKPTAATTDGGAQNVGADGAIAAKAGTGNDVVSMYAGAQWSFGTVPDAAVAADTSKSPVTIGMLNTDDSPIGALPELHQATEAAFAFINAELGGVDGHPLVLDFCATAGIDAAQAESCGRKMVADKVPAVLNGVNLASTAVLPVLAENGIPWVGGIPINTEEMRSPIAFSFSGGTPGAFAAFAQDAAVTRHFKKVAIMYADVAQVADGAKAYGVDVLEHLGVQVKQVTFGLGDQDLQPVVIQATEDHPDALIVGAADIACPKVLQAIVDLKIKVTTYMVGACADRKWLDQVAGADQITGTILNVEGRVDQTSSSSADGELYQEVIKRYGKGVNALGAATVSFRAAMNLWGVLERLAKAGTEITPTAITDALRAAKDEPSFDGHPYTCDGKQMPGLPGLCAPQEVLVELQGAGKFAEVSDGWVDVPKVLADAGITG